jgi:hypothetical protein
MNSRLARPTRKRACAACGRKRPPSGDDPCIENLPGVLYACCGHGVEKGYIYFENGTVVRGFFTQIEYLDRLQEKPMLNCYGRDE